MSAALDAIAALRVMAPAARLAQGLPDPERLALTRARQGLDGGEARPPAEDVLQRLAAELRVLFAPDSGSRAASPRLLRDAPWVLWHLDLIGLPGLFDAVVAAARARPSVLRRLIRAWLRDADPEDPGTARIGRRLGELLASCEDPRLARWLDAQRRFALLDPALGPDAVARALMDAGQPVAAVLDEAGLGEAVVQDGRYLRAVVLAVLARLADALRGPDAQAAWDRLVALLTPDGKMRFAEAAMKGRVAEAALLPWATGRAPEPALRAAIQSFLLRHLGDPRTRPGAWQGVAPEAQLVLRRWLAARTLEAFFAVIGCHADPHWRYRHQFWLGALRRGAITDAWLALGSNVAASARATIADAGAFATLHGGSGDKAALLMRIGDHVLVEWSHSGKLRAWPAGAASAPRLFRHDYTTQALMVPSLPFPETGGRDGLVHAGAENGSWQRRAARFIEERTGIRLEPADWELR